jgi:acyl carrier protein
VGEVLGLDSVDLDQSFFDLGGHSLSAMRLLSRIEQDTGIKVRLIELFRAPNLRAFAAQLATPVDAESA